MLVKNPALPALPENKTTCNKFRGMLPARPGKGKTKPLYMSVQRYSALMDFENSCLSQHWDSSVKPHLAKRSKSVHRNSKWPFRCGIDGGCVLSFNH